MCLSRKLDVVNRLSRGESACSVARLMGVNESTIRSIKKSEPHIRASIEDGTPESAKVTCMPRNPIMEKMEKLLIKWLEEQAQKKVLLTSVMIRDHALEIYSNVLLRFGEINQKSRFQASKGWFQQFKSRYTLRDLGVLKKSTSSSYRNITSDKGFQKLAGPDDWVGNLQHNDVEELLQLYRKDLENLIRSNSEEECSNTNNCESNLTLNHLFEAMHHASSLVELLVQNDSNKERSFTFRRGMEVLLIPYRLMLKELQQRNDQGTVTSSFDAEVPMSSATFTKSSAPTIM